MEYKTSKPGLPIRRYFKYAIGEILLVMVGILLAIQANNWNVNRTAKIDLNQSLNKLLVELNQDITNLNRDINENSANISGLDSCLIILKSPEKYSINQFQELFRYTNYTINFEFAKVTFEELSNSGKLKQLNNTKLSDSLINYYGELTYKAVEDALIHHVRDNIRAYTLEFDYLNFEESDPYKASDFNINEKTLMEYSSDIRIINAIRFKIMLHRIIEQYYRAIIPRTNFLIKTIHDELNSN